MSAMAHLPDGAGGHSRPAADNWDYVIVTASNERQARTYEAQLRVREELGLLAGIRRALVVPDPAGRRVGSGGSTVACLMEVITRELAGRQAELGEPAAWQAALERLRILIVHAGGDSMRLPAYGPCGKAFMPVPGESNSGVAETLFDRQLPAYLALPALPPGCGQVVVAAGDDIKEFDPTEVRLAPAGVTALGCLATPEQASRHGVFCLGPGGQARRFLQKPSPADLAQSGGMDRYGRCVLDIAAMSFDAATAVRWLRGCGATPSRDGRLAWSGPVGDAVATRGLDLYREICCAMGTETTPALHCAAARAGGSTWEEPLLRSLFDVLSGIPLHVHVVPQCRFLHLGTTRELVANAALLDTREPDAGRTDVPVSINNEVTGGGGLAGGAAWVEGCRIRERVTLQGANVVIGVDVEEPLSLPRGACLDVLRGQRRTGQDAWFVRCYGVDDRFKDTAGEGATFCGRPVGEWLAAVGARPEDVWDRSLAPGRRTVWQARLFPAVAQAMGYRDWLWMFAPEEASASQREAWLAAERYSLAEIALLADLEAFEERRARIHAAALASSAHRVFRRDGPLSAKDLAYLLGHSERPATTAAELLREARWQHASAEGSAGMGPLVCSRILHSLGSAVESLCARDKRWGPSFPAALREVLPPDDQSWLAALGASCAAPTGATEWCESAKRAAFRCLEQAVIASGQCRLPRPRSALRRDEIVWGRAPARLELAGGWTDTPPYTLERGGCVLNAAIDLNGQPPIHAYARVIGEPVIRIASIDLGRRIELTRLDELMDHRTPGDDFAVVKAALALSGFSPVSSEWEEGITLPQALESFGGGVELTTLAAVPKGSGLGTSSLMGAVVLAVLHRLMGRTVAPRELFHHVLRLEQAMTTGGGWQDQVGGATDGVKLTTTEPGLVPDPTIQYLPADVLDPRLCRGQALLYYTGMTRLAKNILEQYVGRYLDRDRATMGTLGQIRGLAVRMAEAMGRRDLPEFGRLLGRSWELHKQLNPEATSGPLEALMARVQPFVHGARIVGAGSGGFLLMVCKSPEDAAAVRKELEAAPPNERARFFDFEISRTGLVVTAC
ncbi:MAG TPA: L-fucokinase [Planctomycetota bacterium]|nr:L-fucokinase [Planctomycetota bacterium]HRR82647.1 L-fucokinase [Planctomycetota bacterium]HRT97136.1 L-fucokinase [Planctomycetota bacterium]